MEIDITAFFENAEPAEYSASVWELGENAGRITWNKAIEDSTEYLILDSDDKREAFRIFVKGFGAWSDEEIAAWSDTELNALCLQWISGDLREMGAWCGWSDDEWAAYESDSNTAGRIFRGDDKRVYFSVES